MQNYNSSKTPNIEQCDVAVIGAGLTGLTAAFLLGKEGHKICLLEQQNRVGGQIQTFEEKGYTFESGPNTGVVSNPEVAELFEALNKDCTLDTACPAAKCRLVWKGKKFCAIPSSLKSAISTPLFSWKDKIGILAEPFRAKGTDVYESVQSMTCRRLGKSYFKYAVDPFLSGVYAGDPSTLVTRFALPKLQRLEDNYGSFVKGAMALAKVPKTERDKKATKEVFSAKGGLSALTNALASNIRTQQKHQNAIITGVNNLEIICNSSDKAPSWQISYCDGEGNKNIINAKRVITTVGAYSLPTLLPFVDKKTITEITSLRYAPVVQVSVGIARHEHKIGPAFGGLVPTCEEKPVLGILFPSDCFEGRAPKGSALYSFFMGGIRHPEYLDMSDEEINNIVRHLLHEMLGYAENAKPDVIKIFRHKRAIPQYEKSSEQRFEAIERIEKKYIGLNIAGNLRDGIGMADRIRQATSVAAAVSLSLKEMEGNR